MFCCEGHISECGGYAHPEKRKEYGQYTPVWIMFRDDTFPPYGPGIYEAGLSIDPWKAEHAREFFGPYKPFKRNGARMTLYVSFECYKRERKKYSGGDVDAEHERVLEEVLKWAKGLPNRDLVNNTI